jgi:nitric oxide reductase NorD protein
VADAEDVLIHAAHHVGAATRALWQRRAEPDGLGTQRAAASARRLAIWLAAAGDAPLRVTACDAPPSPSWFARALGRPPPWRERPQAVAWVDGVELFLPRAWLESADAGDGERILLAALALARRAAQSCGGKTPGSAIERDVRFALEAAVGDSELASRFPGLAPALDAARREASATRPSLARLLPVERAVEELVSALLAGPARSAALAVATLGGVDSTPNGVESAARAWSARLAPLARGYRGVAPVAHWGTPGEPSAAEPIAARRSPASATPRHRVPARTLARRVLRRAAEEQDGGGRSGPFVIPHGDPQLALQDARGVSRPEDRGDEDPDALAAELERAGSLPVVRSEGAVREVFESGRRRTRVEGKAAEDGGEPTAIAFLYPEWDAARRAYRDPGIVLRETILSAADEAPGAHPHERAVLLARLRRQFEALRPRRERIGRQIDGDAIDVEGVVAEYAERRAGLAPEGRLYGCARPRLRDVAVLLLVDVSGSTDAWVSPGARVIDVAKEATLCLGEALAALGDRQEILAFSGHGPSDVRVGVAKRFAEPWSAAVRSRVGALQPDRATRLGGPIRHATALLARQPARVRLLLVLSDGKPDDEDVYEGSYGLEDVRQAVSEARRIGVRPFCVTIDRSASGYLPYLFGPAGYTVLREVQQLPRRLPAIYRRLAGV